MDLVKKIDALIAERNINKHILSKESGIPYTTIDGFYKKGTDNIKLSTLIKLCKYFEITLDELISDSDIVKANKDSALSLEHIKFGERLTKLREAKGLNKTQLADFLNVHYTTYNRYETGEREPNISVLLKLSKYYNVTIDYLLGSDQKISPTPKGVGEKETKEIMESAEKIYKALLAAGFVEEGQELTPTQIDFLDGLSAIISAFFDKK